MMTSGKRITEMTRHIAYEEIYPHITGRKLLILRVLDIIGEGSAMDIAWELYADKYIRYPIRNYVQPRLTEMVASGEVEVIGTKRDKRTMKKVAVYRKKEDEQ